MTWPSYSATTRKAVNDLLKRGGSLSAYRANKDYGVEPVKGSYAYRMERELEKRFNVKHAVLVNSGTAALHGALAGLRGPRGDVVTSPYSFSATVSAIILAGFNPVFADVDQATFCITKESVSRVITKNTKAILPVHLFGGLADVDSLKSFGVPVVEDACQAVGAHVQSGKFSGGLGYAGAYSFNGGKNVPAGECGALVTNDSRCAEEARYLSNHGENFGRESVGLNYRPNEVTACIAYHGLLELEDRNQRRIDLAKAVDDNLTNMFSPRWPTDGSHVYYVHPIRLQSRYLPRERFIKRMAKHGIPVGAGYIQPTLQHYKAFRKYARGPLPVVEELSSKTLCILSTLTPDRPLSYAEHVANCMRKSLE